MYDGGMGDEGDYEQEDDYGFEEYAMDDSLDPATRLERYHTSDFALQRLMLVREIDDAAKSCGVDGTVKRILPLLKTFAADVEPSVREQFMQKLVFLVDFILEGSDEGYQLMLSQLLPFTFDSLIDKNVQVGIAACATLLHTSKHVKDGDVDEYIMSHILKLCKDEKSEDCRIVAAQLCDELAVVLGKDRCLASIVANVEELAGDSSPSVRRTVATNLGQLLQVLGPEAGGEKIFPVWSKLCSDAVWGVRKACVEHAVEVSQGVTKEVRRGDLLTQYLKFREDESRWVKVCANQKLGSFIHTFDPEDISADLVKAFVDLAPKEQGQESDFSECCAFAFPAVVMAIGKDRWGELEDAYVTLIKDVQWKVRRSLSFSLHEIAAAVGPEITEKVLTQAWELFIRDLDEVKVGCLTHAAAFISCLPETAREKQIEPFARLPAETENWRVRELIGDQMGGVAQLIPATVCKRLLQGPMFSLCEDQVADVRDAAHKSCAKVLKCLSGDGSEGELTKLIMTLLPDSADKSHFQRRQIFVQVAAACVVEGVSIDTFVGKLEACAEDKVPNVRITLAKYMAEMGASDNKDKVRGIHGKLAADSCTDVKKYAEEFGA